MTRELKMLLDRTSLGMWSNAPVLCIFKNEEHMLSHMITNISLFDKERYLCVLLSDIDTEEKVKALRFRYWYIMDELVEDTECVEETESRCECVYCE